MKCDCCGRKKKLLESFEKVKTDENKDIYLCVPCSDLMYKIRDAANDGDFDEFQRCYNEIKKKKKKSTKSFLLWSDNFISKLK